MRHLYALFVCVLLTSCAETPTRPPIHLSPASYSELPNWATDNHAQALAAFMHSCRAWKFAPPERINGCNDLKMPAANWRSLCETATSINAADPLIARQFFETHFSPYHVTSDGRSEGLFTGYYIPEIRGSKRRGGAYQTPVYGMPPDIQEGKPYYSRAEIYAGALQGRGLEIAWVDDPIALFFVEIQGSGVVRLAEGGTLTIGFAGKNNHPYRTIGKLMKERALVDPDNTNLFTIKEWLYNNPKAYQEVLEYNPSFVFFKPLPDHAVKGAQNVPLTAERSLAVDAGYIPYGTPVYLQTHIAPSNNHPLEPFQRLMIAQDTGGAIKGGIRGDIYFGHGARAEALAGYQKNPGSYSLLLPRALTASLETTTIAACAP